MAGRDRTSTTPASRHALAAIAGAALFIGWWIEPTASRAQVDLPGRTVVREPVSLGTLHGNESSTRIWSTRDGVAYEVLPHDAREPDATVDDAGRDRHGSPMTHPGRGFAGVAEIDLDPALDP